MQRHIQVYAICTGRKFKTALVEKDLLKRYFENTASSEEIQKVNSWLADTSKRPEILAWIESYWKEERMETAPVPAFEEMFGKALAVEKQTGKVVAMKKNRRVWMYAAAASIAFFATGIWMGNYMKTRSSAAGHHKWVLSSAQTGKGQRTQLMLSDGSEVFLNAESELMFPSEITLHPVVYLQGEAYFKLRDSSSSLVIKTRELVTTARGSQINISAFPADSTVTVSVEKGKAEIAHNRETWPMLKIRPVKQKDSAAVITEIKEGEPLPLVQLRKPVVVRERELMTFNKNNGLTAVSLHTDDEIYNWKDGKLSFYQAGEKEIMDKLNRWYGMKVIFTVPLEAHETYTGEFKNATLEEVLTDISRSMHLECKIYSNVVYLIKK